MSEQRRFRVVGDELRSDSNHDLELITALLEGQTVFVPEDPDPKLSTVYTRLRNRHNKVLRRRARELDGVAGYVLWADDPAPDPGWEDVDTQAGVSQDGPVPGDHPASDG